jgi:hypothetical protein
MISEIEKCQRLSQSGRRPLSLRRSRSKQTDAKSLSEAGNGGGRRDRNLTTAASISSPRQPHTPTSRQQEGIGQGRATEEVRRGVLLCVEGRKWNRDS